MEKSNLIWLNGEFVNWEDANKILASKGVTLLSAGLDEVPTVYKNIDKVMEEQQDLVDIQEWYL